MRFQSDSEEDYSLQLTSLIDVVFLLLIFFMVSTSFVDFTRRLDIELPEAESSAEVVEKKSFLIEVGVEKRITLNGKTVLLDNLEGQVESGRRKRKVQALTHNQGGQAPRLRLCDQGDGPHLRGGRSRHLAGDEITTQGLGAL